jgi:hypothetical protein
VVCTDYETIKKELGRVQRFCLKFWVLHPWLNHKDAYEQSFDLLNSSYKMHDRLNHLIDDLLYQHKDLIVERDLLSLNGTTVNESNPERDVFKDSSLAHIYNTMIY